MPSLAEPITGTAHDVVYRVLEGALHRLKMQPGAARHIGLRHLHRIPGQPLDWYLWLSEPDGAWHLRLAGLRHPGQGPCGGLFTVHYYPRPEDAAIHGFSAAECVLRADPACFDETGTPRATAVNDLPADAFAVGTLEILSDQAATATMVRARAQDWWVETTDPGAPPDRRVAGWDLTLRLADRLIQILAFTAGAAPVQVRVGRKAGVYGLRSRRGAPHLVANPLLMQWTLEVVLPLPGPAGPHRVAPDTCAAFAATAAGADDVDWTPALTQPPFARQPFINIAWWNAARWQFPADGSPCSHCEADAARIAGSDGHERPSGHHLACHDHVAVAQSDRGGS